MTSCMRSDFSRSSSDASFLIASSSRLSSVRSSLLLSSAFADENAGGVGGGGGDDDDDAGPDILCVALCLVLGRSTIVVSRSWRSRTVLARTGRTYYCYWMYEYYTTLFPITILPVYMWLPGYRVQEKGGYTGIDRRSSDNGIVQ